MSSMRKLNRNCSKRICVNFMYSVQLIQIQFIDSNTDLPVESNFYLVSHASIQGKSLPTKYHKLWDDNDISKDDLQELPYICTLYNGCVLYNHQDKK